MKENITVNEALGKGKIKLVYLPLLIILCFSGGAYYLHKMAITGVWIYPVVITAGFLIAWLAWSYFVVEWKIWAYTNVRNVNELKRKAIQQKMIWNDGSWFEKTEIWNYEQKQRFRQLEKKFLEKDVYHDDLSVPKETRIFYSRSKLLFEFVLASVVTGAGIYFFTDIGSKKSLLFGTVFCAIGLYMVYSAFKKYQDKQAQIILSDQGITVKNHELVSWDKIWNDRVYTTTNGKSNESYLAFNDEEVLIDDLNIKFEQLEQLLHVYRVRFEKNNPA